MTVPARCTLAVPASERLLARARRVAVDAVVLDLEDAVAPADKPAALGRVLAALAAPGWRARQRLVRVNAPRSPWCHAELAALAQAPVPPDAIVLPKAEEPGDLAFAERLLEGAAPGPPPRLHALVESAGGLAGVGALAAGSRLLDALVLGYVDLAASLGLPPEAAAERGRWRGARDAVVLAARAHGLVAIDGPLPLTAVTPDIAEAAVAAGMDGKWVIHPGQVAAVTAAFTPSGEQVARARAIVGALGEAGVAAVDGMMVDAATVAAARRVLERA